MKLTSICIVTGGFTEYCARFGLRIRRTQIALVIRSSIVSMVTAASTQISSTRSRNPKKTRIPKRARAILATRQRASRRKLKSIFVLQPKVYLRSRVSTPARVPTVQALVWRQGGVTPTPASWTRSPIGIRLSSSCLRRTSHRSTTRHPTHARRDGTTSRPPYSGVHSVKRPVPWLAATPARSLRAGKQKRF